MYDDDGNCHCDDTEAKYYSNSKAGGREVVITLHADIGTPRIREAYFAWGAGANCRYGWDAAEGLVV